MHMRTSRRWIFGAASVCLSAGLLCWLVSRIDTGMALALLRNARWQWLLIASFSAALTPLFCTYRWLGILYAQERTRIPFTTALRAVMLANVLNAFLPSKSGDMAKALYLRQRCGISTGIGTVILERMVDLFLLGILGIAGFFASGAGWGLLAGCLLLGGITLAFLCMVFIPFNRLPLPGRVAHVIAAVRSVFKIWVVNPRAIAITVAGSLGIWCLAGIIVCSIASALHQEVNWGHLIAIFPLAILAGLVPVTISGIGTRDAAFVVLLTGLMPPEAATLVGIGYTIFAYWFVALLSLPWVIREIAHALTPRDQETIPHAGYSPTGNDEPGHCASERASLPFVFRDDGPRNRNMRDMKKP